MAAPLMSVAQRQSIENGILATLSEQRSRTGMARIEMGSLSDSYRRVTGEALDFRRLGYPKLKLLIQDLVGCGNMWLCSLLAQGCSLASSFPHALYSNTRARIRGDVEVDRESGEGVSSNDTATCHSPPCNQCNGRLDASHSTSTSPKGSGME